MLQKGIIFSLILLGFTHCTIQKRTVNKGYFVQWTAKGSKVVNWNKHSKIKVGKEDLISEEYTFSNESSPETSSFDSLQLTSFDQTNQESHLVEKKSIISKLKQKNPLLQGFKLPTKKVTTFGKLVEAKKQKTKEVLKRTFVDDVTIMYLILAFACLLIGLLFFIFGIHAAYFVNLILILLGVLFFCCSILFLFMALFVNLFKRR